MFKKFISFYKPYRKLFFSDMFFATIIAIVGVLYPIIIRRFIGDFVPNRNIVGMLIAGGVLLVATIIKFLSAYFVQYWGHIMGVRMQRDMRNDAFRHLQQLPFSYFDRAETGKIMSQIINDTEQISEVAHHGPEDVIISLMTLVGSFVYLMFISPALTLIIFTLIPILIVFVIKRRKGLGNASRERRVTIGEVNATLENSISGIRVAKAYDTNDNEIEKLKKGNRVFEKAQEKFYKELAIFFSGSGLIIDLFLLINIVLSGVFAYLGKIDLLDFTTYVYFVNIFISPINTLTRSVETLQSGMTGFERIQELLSQPTEHDSLDALQLTHVNGDIVFDNITFKYDKDGHLFSDLTLKIGAGETLALVGPSGGGKSTLCHLIPRFYELDSGQILLDNVNINDYSLISLRSHIGIVQQDTFLFTGTVRDNIAYGDFDATYEEIVIAAQSANIHEYIMTLPDGYDTFVGERGVMLSGGQKQRISIARAFLKNPPILILDEATSALDNATEVAIQKSLSDLSEGRTTLMVAHRLTTVRNADRIAYISENKVVEQGTHEELLEKKGPYFELWRAQAMK